MTWLRALLSRLPRLLEFLNRLADWWQLRQVNRAQEQEKAELEEAKATAGHQLKEAMINLQRINRLLQSIDITRGERDALKRDARKIQEQIRLLRLRLADLGVDL